MVPLRSSNDSGVEETWAPGVFVLAALLATLHSHRPHGGAIRGASRPDRDQATAMCTLCACRRSNSRSGRSQSEDILMSSTGPQFEEPNAARVATLANWLKLGFLCP